MLSSKSTLLTSFDQAGLSTADYVTSSNQPSEVFLPSYRPKTITLLGAKPGTYPKLTPSSPGMPDCAGVRASLKAKRAINARKFAPKECRSGDTLASFIGPSSEYPIPNFPLSD